MQIYSVIQDLDYISLQQYDCNSYQNKLYQIFLRNYYLIKKFNKSTDTQIFTKFKRKVIPKYVKQIQKSILQNRNDQKNRTTFTNNNNLTQKTLTNFNLTKNNSHYITKNIKTFQKQQQSSNKSSKNLIKPLIKQKLSYLLEQSSERRLKQVINMNLNKDYCMIKRNNKSKRLDGNFNDVNEKQDKENNQININYQMSQSGWCGDNNSLCQNVSHKSKQLISKQKQKQNLLFNIKTLSLVHNKQHTQQSLQNLTNKVNIYHPITPKSSTIQPQKLFYSSSSCSFINNNNISNLSNINNRRKRLTQNIEFDLTIQHLGKRKQNDENVLNQSKLLIKNSRNSVKNNKNKVKNNFHISQQQFELTQKSIQNEVLKMIRLKKSSRMNRKYEIKTAFDCFSPQIRQKKQNNITHIISKNNNLTNNNNNIGLFHEYQYREDMFNKVKKYTKYLSIIENVNLNSISKNSKQRLKDLGLKGKVCSSLKFNPVFEESGNND